MTASPAELIAAFLVQAGLVTRPASVGSWSITVGSMPDDKDQWITVVNSDPMIEGKFMDDGSVNEQPRCQIILRSLKHNVGYAKIKAIRKALSALKMITVTADTAEQVLIHAVTVVSGPAWLKQEEKNARQVFSMNVQAAIEED